MPRTSTESPRFAMRVEVRRKARWSEAAARAGLSLSACEPGVPIPFGADRALLAWITTLTYDTGFVTFTSLNDFFEAFQLARSGVQYQRFEQRLHRLLSLSLSVILKTPSGTVRLNMRPLQKAYTPRDGSEARQLLAAENRSEQLSLLPNDLKRYGIVLDPAFHEYLRDNPVVLPLTLMRRFHARPLYWDAASYRPLPLLVRQNEVQDCLEPGT